MTPGMVIYAFKSALGNSEVNLSLGLRPYWSILQVPNPPELHSERTQKQNKRFIFFLLYIHFTTNSKRKLILIFLGGAGSYVAQAGLKLLI